MFICIIESAQQ